MTSLHFEAQIPHIYSAWCKELQAFVCPKWLANQFNWMTLTLSKFCTGETHPLYI